MKINTLTGGVLIGMATIGLVWFFVGNGASKEKLFANKQRCVEYTEKRQVEADEKGALLRHALSVEGFYSPTANTCMTHTYELAPGAYTELILRDEFTGVVEASAFKSLGEELQKLSLDVKQDQVKQDMEYYEKLKYFRGSN